MRKFYPLLAFLLLPFLNYGQYNVNVDAAVAATCEPNYSCFKLTPAELYKKGSVFNTTKVNLNQSFELNTKLYFGTQDGGADGIAFVLQREGTSYIGNWGAGLGYHRFNGPAPMPVDNPGPVPSFIVEFDTWENGAAEPIFGMNVGDPAADHIGFMSNSNAYHTSPTTLKAAEVFSGNIEDGQWHDARFSWNATTKTMTVRFVTQNLPEVVQTFTYSGDIVNTIFGGDPMVYWGFTAATGSVIPNEHHVRIQNPPTPPSCGQLRTQTPGGWGAKPSGNNPGSYLHANFAAAFPSGLRIGSVPNHNALFTSAQAITDFLPSAGQAKSFTTNYTNPTGLKNTLAGHLVALSLSVRFDVVDPNFGTAGTNLGDMLISSGAFANWTVFNFLTEANKVIGGTSNAYTVQQVLSTASAINENYVDGKTNNNYLNCPNPPAAQARSITSFNSIATQVKALPNPTTGNFNLQFNSAPGKSIQVYVLNSNGSIIENRSVNGGSQSLRFDLQGQPSGLYFVRIVSEEGEIVKKMIVQK